MRFLCSTTAIGRHNGDTVMLTANHCLDKGVAYSVAFGDGLMRSAQVWKVPHYEADAEKMPRKYNEPDTDAALFLMKGGEDIPLARVAASSRDLTPGVPIIMIGYPLGIAKISYTGIIAGRLDLPGNNLDGYLLLQIFGAPGSSGSAVMDQETGQIIGVLVQAQQASVGLPVIFATPSEYFENLSPVRGEGETAPVK